MTSSYMRSIMRLIVILLMGVVILMGIIWGGLRGEAAWKHQVQRYRDSSLDVIGALDVEVLQRLTLHREHPANQRLEQYLRRYARSAGIEQLYTLIEQDGLIFSGPSGSSSDAAGPLNLRQLLPVSDQQEIIYDGDRIAVITPVLTAPLPGISLFLVMEQDTEHLSAARRRAYRGPAIISLALVLSLALMATIVLRREGPLFPYGDAVSIAVVLAVITLSATWAVYDREGNDLKEHFNLTADIMGHFLIDDLKDLQEKLDGLGRFYEGSIFVDPWEFEAYAHPLPWDGLTTSWQWIPLLDESGFSSASLLMEQYASLDITQPPGELKGHYLIYAEPLDGFRHLIGRNIDYEPLRSAAVEQARRTGLAAATTLHPLAETWGDTAGAAVFRPVHRDGEYIGSLAVVFSYDQFIEGLFYQHRSKHAGLEVTIFEVDESGNRKPLTRQPDVHHDLLASYPLFLFGKTYEITLSAEFQTLWGDQVNAAASTLIMGLLISLLLTTFVYLLAQWRSQLARRVKTRTQEILESYKRTRVMLDSIDTCIFVTDLGSRGMLFRNELARSLAHGLDCTLQDIFPEPERQEGEVVHQPSGRVFHYASRRINWVGGRQAVLETAREITDEKRTLDRLYSIEWMLSSDRRKADRASRNRIVKGLPQGSGEVFDEVGYDTLDELVGDIMDLTDTSCGMYEKDGTCSFSMIDTPWADQVGSIDALQEGVAKVLRDGEEEHLTLSPGVGCTIYPIYAGSDVAGALHVGWGNPPGAERYLARPPYIIDLARQRGKSSSRLIGEILERRRLERHREGLQLELLHTQKIESVGRLAGGVAHDFNNMLGVILGYTELCLDHFQHDAAALEYLQHIKEAAGRSSVLTRQLLTFARKQPDQVQVIDLESHITDILSMIKRMIGVQVTLVYSPRGPVWPIQADPSQLDQILLNLCSNAADALGPGGGTVEIRLANYHPDDQAEPVQGVSPRSVELVVSDNGAGMDEHQLEHLFDPFYTTKEQGKGTGLGLSTVYGIVTRYGGTITVESSPGRGSTFILRFPAFE